MVDPKASKGFGPLLGGHSVDTGNTGWMLMSSALVLLMTPGLAFFYGGLVRRKNVVGTIMHSFTAMAIIGVIWVLWGYTLAFGPDKGGFIGGLDYLGLRGILANAPKIDSTSLIFVIFQGMFAIITPALITGAFAERMKFSTYVVFAVVWVTIVYAPMAHWVWGGGWLQQRGVLDFAGGVAVHMDAGIAALCAAIIIGKRKSHAQETFDSHNIPFVLLGTGLLWFGWFGFNAGSALAANGSAVLAFATTNAAAAMGAMTWLGFSWIFSKKASAIGAAAGAVAGLGAITPAAGFVGVMPALIIGLVAGTICFIAVYVVRERLNLDDSLDVFAVHGIGGTWGVLATGLFAGVGTMGVVGLADGVSRGQQILNQLIGIGAAWAWSFAVTAIILLALKYTIGLRVDEKTEEQGLDIAVHGDEAYPNALT